MVNVAVPCESQPHRGVNDPAQRFANRKARFYEELADAFERDQVEGLTDEKTIGQPSGILYEIDSQGRIKIESKEKARERGATVARPRRGADARAVQTAAGIRLSPSARSSTPKVQRRRHRDECSPSARVGQFGVIEEERVLGSS
jgi:hypothetical protein